MNETSDDSTEESSEVASGVHRFGTRRVNWYLVEDDGELLVVDAGMPGHYQQLLEGIDDLGYGLDDVVAVVLTHGHTDHIGFANRLRETEGVPVLVHEADVADAKGEGDQSQGEVFANLWRPAMLALLFEFARDGGLSIPPVEVVETYEDGDRLDVPGTPRAIHAPGHSPGSCVLNLEDRSVLLCGDVLATLDIKTGRARGPQLMSLFNADVDRAAASLDRLESIGEVMLLPGHGDPWRGEMLEAVRLARERK